MHSTAVAAWLLLAVFGSSVSNATPVPKPCGEREVQEVLGKLRTAADDVNRNMTDTTAVPPYISSKGYTLYNGKLFDGKLFPLSLAAKKVTIERSLCCEEEHIFGFTIPVGENEFITGPFEFIFKGEDGTEGKRHGKISVIIKGATIKGKLILKQSAARSEQPQLIYEDTTFIGSSAGVVEPVGVNVPYHHIMDDALRSSFDAISKFAEIEAFPQLKNVLDTYFQ